MSYNLRIIGERLENILQDLATGKNALPIFQRGYVWERKDVRKLADSIIKGIPLGNIFLWETGEVLQTIDYSEEGIVNTNRPESQQYIIDGGQRSMTIYGLAHGLKIGKVDFDGLYIDGRGGMADLVDGDISVYYLNEIKELDPENEKWYVPVKYYFWKSINSAELAKFRGNKEDYDYTRYQDRYYFMQDEFYTYIEEQKELTESERTEIYRNFAQISSQILGREISVTRIDRGSLQNVLSLFERTNQEGIKLREVEIMNAVLYNPKTGFYYTDELEKLADEVVEDTGLEYRSGKADPYKLLNNMVKYMVFGTYVSSEIQRGTKLFNADLINNNWKEITRAIYNTAYEIGYKKNTSLNLCYKEIPIMLWASFFYQNNNEEQTEQQQKSMDDFIRRLLGTSYFEGGAKPQKLRSLSKYIGDITNSKDKVVKLTPDMIKSATSGYMTVSEIIQEAEDAKTPTSSFNQQFYYMQEIRGNFNLFTGAKIEGNAQELDICHIFPKNTHKEVSNNVFNFIRQPKSVNNDMGHGEPSVWINKVDPKVLEKLFIDEECIRHIRHGRINEFINRRAQLFYDYYRE